MVSQLTIYARLIEIVSPQKRALCANCSGVILNHRWDVHRRSEV